MFSLGSKKTDEAVASDWKTRLKRGLSLTGERLKKVAGVFRAHPKIDEALYEALEAQLLAADVGVRATAHLIDSLRKATKPARSLS
jgi:fused signal recognition particle receptor